MAAPWKVKTSFSPKWNEGLRAFGLRMFLRDGMAAAVMQAMTAAFLSAFALMLGADAIYIGLLSALPTALWTIALLPAAKFDQNNLRMRKWIVVGSATVSRLFWIPIILIGLLSVGGNIGLTLLMIFVVLSTVSGAFSTPAWSSLVGDLVPDNVRGRYFSRRTIATTSAGLSASLAAGWALDMFGRNNPMGFVVIFSVGLAFGLMSSMFFARIPNPPPSFSSERADSSFKDVWRNGRFRTFLILFGIWQFGIMLSAPFLNVFLLDTLSAGYIWISIFAVVGGIAGIIVQRGWGVFSDRYGHRVMMIISAFGTVPAIILWAFAADPLLLIPVEIFSGMVWAGFTLANYNYMLEISPSRSRAVFAAMFNVVIGVAGVFGPIIGGVLASYFFANPLFGFSGYRVLFLTTGVIRFVTGILFLLFLAEVVEKRERVSPGYVFGEMMKYGVQGGLLRGHHAAGGAVKDVSTIERSLKTAAKVVGKDVHTVVRTVEEMFERVTDRADRRGQRIVDGGTSWHTVAKKGVVAPNTDGKLKVKVDS